MKQGILTVAALLALAASVDGHAQAYSRTDATTYDDNLRLWVVGQPSKSINIDTGLVESETRYDPATALPVETYAFGKLGQKLTYNADGTVSTVSDGRDAPTYDTTIGFGSWKRGIPQTITFPDGYTRIALVDDLGLIREVTDEVGNKTCHAFDAMGRLTQVTYPSDTQLRVCDTSRWNALTRTFAPSPNAELGLPAGHWKETVATGNGVQVTHYDALWRPLVVERFDGTNATTKAATLSQTVTTYAPQGGVAFQSYPTTAVSNYATVATGTRITYDALGRPLYADQDSELGLLRTTYDYQAGFLTKVTRPDGSSTTTSYQAFDQPSTDQVRGIAFPEGVASDIPRDVFGKPIYITRRNADRSVVVQRLYGYNAAQELCRTVEPETGATLLGYDAAGNLAWSASGLPASTACESDGTSSAVLARKSTRAYDNRNRLTDLGFADDIGEQHWEYTPDGLPSKVWAWNGPAQAVPVINAYSYNSRRMLGANGELLEQPGWYAWAMGYGYDRNGFPTVQNNPDGSIFQYTVNPLGQNTEIRSATGTLVTGATYYPNGALRRFTYGNGIVHDLAEQNLRGLPQRTKDYRGSIGILDDSYTYDAAGNVAAISDGLPGARGNRTMTYDGLDRLASANSPMFGGTIRYSYDVLDNIATLVGPGRNLRYCYDGSNRISFIRSGATNCTNGSATTAFAFDVQGNVQSKNAQPFVFSQDNRLREVTNVETYRYDAHGRRVLQWSPTVGNLLSFYNQAGQLAFQRDQRVGRNLNQAYVYLSGSLVAVREGNYATGATTVKYQHTDALGSPVAVTDAVGAVLERAEYEPFGKVLNRALHDGPGFTGHATDAQTGLTYMQQRYFDPIAGVFLSVDPVGVRSVGDNFHRYWYANSNPYRYVDPDGRQSHAWAAAHGDVVADRSATTEQLVRARQSGWWAGIRMVANYYLDQLRGGPGSSASPAASPLALVRGIASEARVLDALSEVKNTEKFATAQGDTIPDFVNSTTIGEIKDAKRVTDSAQLRAQRELAAQQGKDHVVVTGERTQVSSTVDQQSTVMRRDDLGPSQ